MAEFSPRPSKLEEEARKKKEERDKERENRDKATSEGRRADELAGKDSLADQLKEERIRKQKRLDEIMGKNK